MQQLTEFAKNILSNHATSYWLSEAIERAYHRDPVDALSDAQLLVDVLKERLRAVTPL
jgi:hypothetical protein